MDPRVKVVLTTSYGADDIYLFSWKHCECRLVRSQANLWYTASQEIFCCCCHVLSWLPIVVCIVLSILTLDFNQQVLYIFPWFTGSQQRCYQQLDHIISWYLVTFLVKNQSQYSVLYGVATITGSTGGITIHDPLLKLWAYRFNQAVIVSIGKLLDHLHSNLVDVTAWVVEGLMDEEDLLHMQCLVRCSHHFTVCVWICSKTWYVHLI